MAESQLPSTLNGIFDPSLKNRYDPVRLTSDNIVPILELPLAKKVFGHDATDTETIAEIANSSTSYTTFADQARAALQTQHGDLTSDQIKSQLLHLGLATLFSFLQSNVTGPPLTFSTADTVPLTLILTPSIPHSRSAARMPREQDTEAFAAKKQEKSKH